MSRIGRRAGGRVGTVRNGASHRVSTVVEDLLTGQYEQPAQELARRVADEGREISETLQWFIESHSGRAIGVQLALPLRGL